MNVMLNLPVDTGNEWTGPAGRRASDASAEGDDFGRLFAQVGQTADADRGAPPVAVSGDGTAPDDAETARAEVAPRGHRQRPDGEPATGDATAADPGDGVPAEAGGRQAADGLPAVTATTADPARQDADSPDEPVRQDAGPADTAEAGDQLPSDRIDALPAKARAAGPSADVGIAHPEARGGRAKSSAGRQTVRSDAGQTPAVAVPANGGADLRRTDRQDGGRTHRASDGAALAAQGDDAAPVTAGGGARTADGGGRRRHVERAESGQAARREGGLAGRAGDDDGTPANASAAAPMVAFAAAPAPATKTTHAPTDAANAHKTDRARDDAAPQRQARPGDAGKTVQDASGAASDAPAADRRQPPADGAPQIGLATAAARSAEPADGAPQIGLATAAARSAQPAASEGQGDAAPIRYWARGDTAAALAAAAARDRRQQTGTTSSEPPTDRQSARSPRRDRPIDVRVAAYERQRAPAGFAGGTKPAIAPEGAANAGGTPAPEAAPSGADRGGSPAPEGRRSMRPTAGWRPLTAAARSGEPAAAKAPSDHRAPSRLDPAAAPDAGAQPQSDAAGGDDGRPVASTPSAPSAEAKDKRQPVNAAPTSGGNPAASPSAPASAPSAPLTTGVATGIANALAAARATAGAVSAPARVDTAMEPTAAEPVRTLALTLDMPEYGQVDLRISLKGNTVSIQLKAERAETAAALARDDASLRDALHRAGYEAQQVQIDRRDAVGPRPADAAAGSGQSLSGGAGSGASSGHAAGGERAATPDQRPQARRDADGFAPSDQEPQNAPRQDRYRGPDRLYV